MIRIAPTLMRQMREHAAATYPDECCGALLGADEAAGREVRGLCPIENQWNAAPLDDEGHGTTARRRFLAEEFTGTLEAAAQNIALFCARHGVVRIQRKCIGLRHRC